MNVDNESDEDDYIRRLVAQAPPLTDEQRTRLAALLRPVSLRGAA